MAKQIAVFFIAFSLFIPSLSGQTIVYEAEAEPPPSQPTYVGVEELIARYDWDFDQAIIIKHCESSGNPNAVGDKNTAYYSYGLFQIRALPGRPDPEWLKIPENNIDYAYKLWSETRSFNKHWVNCSKLLG